MPSLAFWVYRKHGGKAFNEVRPMYRGLFCAMLGDFFLDFHQYKGNNGPWFIIGMLSFLLMQVVYMRNFRKMPEYKGVSTVMKVFYVFLHLFLNYNLLPKLPSDLQIPILFYTFFLAGMAAISSGVGLRMGLGGFIFLVSDAMIGANIAKLGIPFGKEIVIVTYLVAQFLIITDWSRKIHKSKKRTD